MQAKGRPGRTDTRYCKPVVLQFSFDKKTSTGQYVFDKSTFAIAEKIKSICCTKRSANSFEVIQQGGYTFKWVEILIDLDSKILQAGAKVKMKKGAVSKM